MPLPDRHLDLGCGKFPRNPYARGTLCGVDIRPLQASDTFDYRVANLSLQPIPWEDGSFGSVSAFDFIEHVPRVLADAATGTRFPFIELMNEVWRVLAPGGLFYALTPAYPYAAAFTDPTHVNVITAQTHDYFCGESPMGRMYGFGGRFEARRVHWTHPGDAYGATPGSPDNRRARTGAKRVAEGLRNFARRLRGQDVAEADGKVYLLWELEARKRAP
ncbi:MAG TPA: methyltransferase domain-containing protein [Xanthomonadaceae bacterium]|nr:methyltransferase domain-containing protein [Xanthomonadaceae bacterium]